MRRSIYDILTGASLLICVGVVVLWVRSYWIADSIKYAFARPNATPVTFGGRFLFSSDGRIALRGVDFSTTNPKTAASVKAQMAAMGLTRESRPRFEEHGFESFDWRPRAQHPYRDPLTTVWMFDACMPHWFVALLWSVFPAVWLLRRSRWLARRRRAMGLCACCGYDLRGGGDRCPECGEQRPSLLPDVGYNST